MILNIILNIAIFYALFCFSVGLTSWFTIYKPVLDKLRERNEEVWEYYSGLTAFCIAVPTTIILAPMMFHLVLTGPDDEFTEGLIDNLIEKHEE